MAVGAPAPVHLSAQTLIAKVVALLLVAAHAQRTCIGALACLLAGGAANIRAAGEGSKPRLDGLGQHGEADAVVERRKLLVAVVVLP